MSIEILREETESHDKFATIDNIGFGKPLHKNDCDKPEIDKRKNHISEVAEPVEKGKVIGKRLSTSRPRKKRINDSDTNLHDNDPHEWKQRGFPDCQFFIWVKYLGHAYIILSSMISTTLFKLGGSVLTDKAKPYVLDQKTIESLSHELSLYEEPFVVFHGNGSYGHTSASQYGGKKGYLSKEGIATVHNDVLHLHSIVVGSLVSAGIPAISFRPSSMMTSKDGEVELVFLSPLFQAMSQGLVPVLPGDVIWDSTWKSTIFSGERLINILLPYFGQNGYTIQHVIEVGETNGVLTNDGNTISHITQNTMDDILKHLKKPVYKDVTGGMIHKVEEALTRARHGVKTSIINGKTQGELTKALRGESISGTVVS